MSVKIEVSINGVEPLVDALNAFTETIGKAQLVKEIRSEGKGALVKAEEDSPEKPKQVTLEEVRAILAKKSQSGKQAEVKALITKYGAKKLSDIPKEKYPNLLKDAEDI